MKLLREAKTILLIECYKNRNAIQDQFYFQQDERRMKLLREAKTILLIECYKNRNAIQDQFYFQQDERRMKLLREAKTILLIECYKNRNAIQDQLLANLVSGNISTTKQICSVKLMKSAQSQETLQRLV